MTRLLLIRHAESEWNAQKRWQGRADPPLSENGRAEAARAADALTGVVDVVAASPQVRAQQTAAILRDVLSLGDITTVEDLREIDVGVFTGLRIEEVEAQYGAELAAWREGTLTAAPGGEDRADFLARILRGLDEVREAYGDRRVLVITHGGVIGQLERHLGCWRRVDGSTHLSGRWFTNDDGLHADDERTSLISDSHGPAPEAR
jgi:broad specificity phosphatase PhoE